MTLKDNIQVRLIKFRRHMALIVFGIKNCSTVKSAINWFNENGVDYEFHDFKSRGIDEKRLKSWSSQVGWEALVNKRGTTWRKLPRGVQESVKGQTAAIALMKEKTSVIKRPVITSGDTVVTVGFDEEEFRKRFF